MLRRALELEPDAPEIHARLFARTGVAPREPRPTDSAEAEALVFAHPYDPWALLEAARAAPDRATGLAHLRGALFTADLDPASARVAAQELVRLDPAMQERRFVAVHFVADETVRADPAWRFRLRLALNALSVTLDPALRTRFLSVTLAEFDGSGAGADLSAITAAGLASLRSLPERGILAIVTERRPPPRRGKRRLGEAEFLGRRLTARLEQGEVLSRVLAHEVLHLFGAVHLSGRVDSLMNPDGGDWILREPNANILRQLRVRRFGPGGFDANVLPYVDIAATADAYIALINTNLLLRREGIDEILDETVSRRARAQRFRREVKTLDPNMADVCDFTGRLLFRSDRPEEAVQLFELAARLYGLRTAKAKDSLRRAVAVREAAGLPDR